MPSAKSRAAKAATAARVAAYNAAAAALDSELPLKATSTVDIGNMPGFAPDFEGLTGRTPSNTIAGVLTSANSPMLFKPTLPSMLNLNTSPNMSRALAVGAVVVGAEQTGNPSDEENVQPMPLRGRTTPASTTSANKVEERSARALSPILGNIDNEKDMRAYEFERQKAKRAGDFAKRKASKAAKASGYVSGGGGGGHSHTGRVASEGSAGDGGRKEVKSRINRNDMDVDIAEAPVGKPVAKIASRIDRDKGDMPSNGQIEVSLSELVLRQKKPRKIKEDDFEMISPVRPVIVLDDLLEVKDMDMDEPWEHVERDFEAGKKPKEGSYAAVLLGMAH